jgi:hypothetical protein
VEIANTDLSAVGQLDNQQKVEKNLPEWTTLPGVDPRIRAIYAIPEQVFIPEAGRALGQFHTVASEFLTQLRDTGGSLNAVREDWPLSQAKFEAMIDTALFVIDRLRGENVDGMAKMSLNTARKAFSKFEQGMSGKDLLGSEVLRECQIAVDSLNVGLNMLAYPLY